MTYFCALIKAQKMMKYFQKLIVTLLFINLFSLALFADDGEPVKDEKLVKVSGKVIDADTGEELTGVRFIFEGEEEVFYSDPMGAFDIETIAGSQAKLKVTYISYEAKLIEVEDVDFFLIKLSRKNK